MNIRMIAETLMIYLAANEIELSAQTPRDFEPSLSTDAPRSFSALYAPAPSRASEGILGAVSELSRKVGR